MTYRIVSLAHDSSISAVVAERCIIAHSFFSRFKGLIGKNQWAQGEGLLLRPCHEIHMWWMQIPIDVVFLQRESLSSDHSVQGSNTQFSQYYRVTSVREGLKPWKLLPVRDGTACDTLELPTGTIRRCELMPGARLEVRKN